MTDTSSAAPGKKSTPADPLVWFDWAVLFLLVIIVVAVSPWDILVNAVICGLILVLYRVTLRKVWIRVFPSLYHG